VSSRGNAGLLDAHQIRELLAELGRRIDARGLEGRMFLVGGAAMALAFSRERVTRDLDAVFEPKSEIYQEAAAMAREHRLPPIEGAASFTAPGLHVGVASPEYLFAMKAMAARQETDGEDLRTLARVLTINDVRDALDLVERFYGSDRLSMKTQLILESILTDGSGA
jgi:predicted nucleotidyltransferase